MKRLLFLTFSLCACIVAFAQRVKVETFDTNKWHWTERTDKYQSVTVDNGFLVISNLKKNKKATDYQNVAKSYAKLPFRPTENFKVTVKYFVTSFYGTLHYIMFNTDKKCLEDEEESGQYESYFLTVGGGLWGLQMGDGQKYIDKWPSKVKDKKDFPMEFILEKKFRNVTIELNGIQLYEGELSITNPCIGFHVPLINQNTSSIRIDEVIVEQAEQDD